MSPSAIPGVFHAPAAHPAGGRAGGLSTVAAWLLGRGDPPPADELRAAGLAAYAYSVLPPQHPHRAALRTDFLAALTRHHRIKAELLPLLRAWQQAGIQVLLFKGFHLAEFVYPVPGARFHGDVDVLLRPEHVAEARRTAERAGWGVDYDSAEVGHASFHTAVELVSPGRGVLMDVHRYAVESTIPWSRRKRRVTDAVWARARTREWEGVRVWEMDAVDALLVGLVLGRGWGADAWSVKAHDAVDWRLLRERCGVEEAGLQARARELGCTRTLRLFRERCDPDAGRLLLGPPSRAWLRRARALSAMENFAYGGVLLRARRAPRIAAEAALALRYVLRARRAVRGRPDMRELLASLTPGGDAVPGSLARRFHTTRGVRWAARLLPRSPGGGWLVRPLALYTALREQGWPVSFVSGERRQEGRVTRHAWVELDGRVLPELSEPTNPEVYRESFRYP